MRHARCCARVEVALVCLALAACGDEQPDPRLLTHAHWRLAPGRAADIGYWVSVDVGRAGRAGACTPQSSTVQVTVNGRPARRDSSNAGDCVWNMLFEVGPFEPDDGALTVVRVLDGPNLVGEATYGGLFPGYPARLVAPVDGKLRPGESVLLTVLEPLPAQVAPLTGASYLWLDPPELVPPFQEPAEASLATDRMSITVSPPPHIGRAALTVPTGFEYTTAADTCRGFSSCAGWPSSTIGPVIVEATP